MALPAPGTAFWLGRELRAPAARGERAHDPALDGLRGLCAYLVLYAHAFTPEPALDPIYAPSPVFWWFDLGTAAVLIFFVLSGYVIGVSTGGEATPAAVKGYLGRRAWRLIPINTCAVLLSWALWHRQSIRAVFGNLVFLENWAPYPILGEWPLLRNNQSLWTLNFEVVYYLAFILVWRFAPSLRLMLGIAGGLVILGAAGQTMPVVFSAYAAGAFFWFAGLAVAWHLPPSPALPGGERRTNWLAACAGVHVVWMLAPLRTLFDAFHWHSPSFSAAVSPQRFDFLLAATWLLLAVTGRAPGLHRRLGAICLTLASAAWLARWAGGQRQPFDVATGLALIAGWWLLPRTFSLAAMRRLAALGGISFAVYAIGLPCQFSLRLALPSFAGSEATFALRVIVLFALVTGTAWLLERRFCPWLKRRFAS